MAEEFYSFEKVLRELKLQEDELKRLVSEGEIRAFRFQDQMKFKKEDIERFRTEDEGDSKDVIEALDAESGAVSASSPTIEAVEELPDELVFDEDEEVGMATEAIADDSFLEEDAPIEDLELEEVAVAKPGRSKSKSRGGGKAVRSAAPAARSRPPAVPKRARASAAATDEEASPVWAGVLVVSAVLTFLAVIAAMDAAAQQSSPITGWIKDLVKNSFMGS